MKQHTHRSVLQKFLSVLVITTFLVTGIIQDMAGPDWGKVFAGGSGSPRSGGDALSIMREIETKGNQGPMRSFQTDLFTGRAETSIPIFTPPGRRGLTPQVSLGYSSSGGNSWLGVGWNFDQGFIQRSTKKGIPTYDNNQDTFTFLVQGVNSDLVRIPNTDEYHAKDESGEFLKFIFQNNNWIVYDKSGTEYTFGQTDQAKQTNPRGIFSWNLEKVKDTLGGTIEYIYTQDQGKIYLSRIKYNGNETQNFDYTHTVDFILEDRPDNTSSYITGARVETNKRLKTIEVKVQNQLSRKYNLSYEQSPNVRRSRLTSIQECGTDEATCLPPQTFTYTNHQMQLEPGYQTVTIENGTPNNQSNWNGTRYTYSSDGTDYVDLLDMNGDGILDRVMIADPTGYYNKYRIQMNSPADWFGPMQNWNIINADGNVVEGSIRSVNAIGATQLDTFDINGDGLPDRVFAAQDYETYSVLRVEPNTGTGFGSPITTWQIARGGPGWWWARLRFVDGSGSATYSDIMDINGDGLIDRVMSDENHNGNFLRVQLNTGTNFGPIQIWPLDNPNNILSWRDVRHGYLDQVRVEMVDLNGDGLPDRVYADIAPPYNYWLVSFNNGSGFDPVVTWPIENGSGSTDVDEQRKWGAIRAGEYKFYQDLIDVNGDGLVDRVMSKANAPYDYLRVQFNTGSGFLPSVNWDIHNPNSSQDEVGGSIHYGQWSREAETIDINGDGLPDRVHAIRGGNENQWKVAKQLGPIPDLLQTINNGRGGVTTLEYTPSTDTTKFDNHDINGVYRLPFPVQAVTKVTQTDGLGGSYVTNYSYKGGMYDAPTREFRGFREVTVTDARGTQTIHTFLQDDALKGRTQRTETRDQNNNPFTKVENAWTVSHPHDGVNFVQLTESNSFLYDGDSTNPPKHTRKRFEYDPTNGNLLNVFDDGDPAITTDDRRQSTVYTHNDELYIYNTIAVTTTFNSDPDPNRQKTSEKYFYYDNHPNLNDPPTQGLLTKQVDLATAPDPNPTTQMTYDSYGNIETITDARNVTTTNQYDPIFHLYLTKITNILNHTQEFTYNELIAQITETRDQNQQVTRTIYDPLGRAIKVISPLDTETSPTQAIIYDDRYDPSQNLLNRVVTHTKVDTNAPTLPMDDNPHTGYLTTYTFLDGLGREREKRTPGEEEGKQIVSGFVTFDERGQTQRQYLPYFSDFRKDYATPPTSIPYASFDYDAVGRRTTIHFPDNTQSSVQYDHYTKTVTDQNGHIKRYTQDSSGNLSKVEELNNGQTYITRYEYDSLNRLTNTTNHLNHTTTITYNLLGRKKSMDDPNMGHWTYTYDLNGNLQSQRDAKNQTILFLYDALNRLTHKLYPTDPDIRYFYDACPPDQPCQNIESPNYSIGRLVQVTDPSGAQTFKYNELGRVIQDMKYPDNGESYSFTRIYDALGRVATLQYPDEEFLHLTFNPMGEAETLTLINQDQTTTPIITNVNYTAAGQITKIRYGNGLTTGYLYDEGTLRLKRLLTTLNASFPSDFTIDSPTPNGALQNFQYQFDNVGNVQSITDSINTNTQSFVYDNLDRLTQATGSYGTRNYQYDAIGNMIQKGPATLEYTDTHHPQAVTSYRSQDTSIDYQYDANGNMIKRGNETLTYDVDNRLIQIGVPYVKPRRPPLGTTNQNPGFQQSQILFPRFNSEFVYDASGQRVKKTSRGGTTYYLGKDYEIEFRTLAPVGQSGQLTRKAFFLGEQRIAEKELPEGGISHFRWFHQDHLGSTNIVTNELGQQTLLMEYLPYGEEKIKLGSDPVHNTFTGQKSDSETGLMYYNARYYDPKIGRFITADWIIPDPTNPQEFNRYSYVNNNPIKFTDPTGHKKKKKSFWKSFFKWTGIVAGVVLGIAFGVGLASVLGPVMNAALGTTLGSIATGAISGAGGAVFGNGIANAFQGRNPFDGAGNAAIAGAAFGGLDAGFSQLPKGNSLGSRFGMEMMRVTAEGATGGGIAKMSGGDFWTGVIISATVATSNYLYRESIALRNKNNVRDSYLTPSSGEASLKGPGQDAHVPEHSSGYGKSNFGYGDKPGFFSETSPAMRALSLVPGANGSAYAHDHWMGGITGAFGRSSSVTTFLNFATMPPAAGLNYAGSFHAPSAMPLAINYDDRRRD